MDVAIVGAGFSGTLLAYHLLRDPAFTGTVTWWEKRAQRSQGIAYATPCRAHVLNVAAQNMAALPGEPGHLLDWLHTQDTAQERSALHDTYVPRMDYARYLHHTTAATFAAAGARLVRIDDEAIDVQRGPNGKQTVLSHKAAPVQVDKVALCVGHFAPQMPQVPGAELLRPPHFLANPWDTQAIAAIAPRAVVASLGAGLTLVDLALQLQGQSFHGQLVAISRHGLWPRSHVTRPSAVSLPAPAYEGLTAAKLMHWLRQHVRQHVAHGGDWRQVVDALRPHTQKLWQALGTTDQARILRHAKSQWDSHRHRVAPHVGQLLGRMRHDGQLLHHAGRLQAVSASKGGKRLQLHWQLRHNPQVWRQDVDVLVNCTGAHNVWPKAVEALPKALLASGRVAPAVHGTGLALRADGAVCNQADEVDASLWAMGPARLGIDFESVAVPELRVQAQALAQKIAQS